MKIHLMIFQCEEIFLLDETMSGWQDPVLCDDGASTDMPISVCLEAEGREKKRKKRVSHLSITGKPLSRRVSLINNTKPHM